MVTIPNDKVLAEADAALRVWKTDPNLKLKDITLEAYEKMRDDLQAAVEELAVLESQYTAKLNQRDGLAADLNVMNIRLRSAARGYFGADSTEYEQLGGTRTSERKRPARRAIVPSAPK